MSAWRSVLVAVVCLLAGCGESSTGLSALQQLQATSADLRRAGNLSAAVATDMTVVDSGMAKDRSSYVRRHAVRLVRDSSRLKLADTRALRMISPLPARLSGPARHYAQAMVNALQAQRHEAAALISVGRLIQRDPLLERAGSIKALRTELRARRYAARVTTALRRASRIRHSHPKAFTYVPRANG